MGHSVIYEPHRQLSVRPHAFGEHEAGSGTVRGLESVDGPVGADSVRQVRIIVRARLVDGRGDHVIKLILPVKVADEAVEGVVDARAVGREEP